MSKFSRRQVLQGAAATGAALSTPLVLNAASHGFVNDPTKSGKLVFGFNVPQTGPYSEEGKDELRAYELAVEHINGGGDGGMLNTMTVNGEGPALKGNGILGMKLDYVTGDTQTKSDAARASARKMIENEGVIMFSGGSSSGVAIAVQGLAQEKKVIFMCGLTHSNDTTGKDRKRYGFRHFFNAHMSGAALAPVLQKAMGSDRRAYHLTADYTWGWSQEESIMNSTGAIGWETVNAVRTPLKTSDFSSFLTPVLNSGADVLVLNHYGKNMVDSLTQAVQLGMRDKMVNGKQLEIVVPLYSRLMAQGAGENVKGIYGSTGWSWQLTDAGSQAFTKSFGSKYGFPPSQAAHTCYVQTLLYANACELAGTFDPAAVIPTLEGMDFDGMGNGPVHYRAEDHQCFKDVLVVKGKDNPSSNFDLLEIVEVTPRAQVEYDPNLYAGDLGPI
jgi:ABC-type branched-subunit amino acid transport system substrate-binding protein